MKRPRIKKGELVKLHHKYVSMLGLEADASTVFMVWTIGAPDRFQRRKLSRASGESFQMTGQDGAAAVIIINCRTRQHYDVTRRMLWRMPNQPRDQKKATVTPDSKTQHPWNTRQPPPKWSSAHRMDYYD